MLALVEHPMNPATLGAPPHLYEHEGEYSYRLEGGVSVLAGECWIEESGCPVQKDGRDILAISNAKERKQDL